MAQSLMYPLFCLVESSPHLLPQPGEAQISIHGSRFLQTFNAQLLHPSDVDHRHLLIVGMRELLIHTDQDLPHVQDLQEDIARDQDLCLRARDHHPEEEEVGGIALVAMAVVDGEEALAIAVTVAMMLGAEAEAVEEEVEVDARQGACLREIWIWSLGSIIRFY